MRDRFTGQARGFGFVEINDDGAAQRAVDACHGKDLMGRTVVVNEARPMAPREGGGARPPRRSHPDTPQPDTKAGPSRSGFAPHFSGSAGPPRQSNPGTLGVK